MTRTLVIMVKDPKPGRVKTRLGRDIGNIGAVWWYRHQCRRLLRRLADPRWQLVLAISPDRCVWGSTFWPTNIPRVPQGKGDLGARMARQLRQFGPSPVVLIGSDIPRVNKGHIRQAFEALGSSDIVIGPATDGGFWLIGQKGMPANRHPLFRKVRWSSPHTLSDTLEGSRPLLVSKIEELNDVDTGKDL